MKEEWFSWIFGGLAFAFGITGILFLAIPNQMIWVNNKMTTHFFSSFLRRNALQAPQEKKGIAIILL